MADSKETEETEVLSKKSNYFFLLLYALAIILLFLMFRPFLSFMILGGIIVLLLYPLNNVMKKHIKNRMFCSLIMTLIVLILLLVPSIFITVSLAKQSVNFVGAFSNLNLEDISANVSEAINYDIDLNKMVKPALDKFTDYVMAAVPSIFNSFTTLAINIFIMFFLIYYGFKEGDRLVSSFMAMVPITKSHKTQLTNEAKKVLYGVIYMQMLIAAIQGILGGIGFWIFGIPNPVLWGFVMAILAFIPFLGTPLVWIPAVIFELSAGNVWTGIGLLLYSGILVMNIDNLLKPKLIGDETGLHPILVLIGIFGGMSVFGIIGMVIGPVVVALCALVIKFFNRDVRFG